MAILVALLVVPPPTSAQDCTPSIRVDLEPVAEIGGLGGPVELYRVTDGLIEPGGTMLLVNGGTNEILRLGMDGTLLRRVGGEGAGPGEFRRLSEVRGGPEGQVYAYDPGLQRLTIFDEDLDLVRSIPMTALGSRIGSAGSAGGDDFWILGESRLTPGPPGRTVRDTVQLSWYSSRTGRTTELVRLPGSRTASFLLDGSQGARFAPFTPAPMAVEAGRCLVFAAGDEYVFRLVTSEGRALHTVRLDIAPARLTDDAVATYETELLRSLPDDAHPLARRLVEQLPFPERLPALHALEVDPSGLVWLERYRPPTGVSGSWIVTTLSGDLVEEVRLSEPMKVLDVGRDHLLARKTDELGVETVGVYRIRRDGRDRLPDACR